MTDGTLAYRTGARQLLAATSRGVMVTKRIFLVDDSAIIRVAMRHFLESLPGFEVCGEAADGFDALQKARDLNPDIIILDLAMPRLSGLEIARELRVVSNHVPIILFTWYADAVQAQDAIDAGINAVVSKTNPAALQNHINSLLVAA